MKKNFKIIVGGIIVLTTSFTSCKKEAEMQPKEFTKLQHYETNAGQNNEFSPWLKFANRKEYVDYTSKVKDILEHSTNSDSVLDIYDNQHSFISLRKFYNDTLSEARPNNASEELAHGTLAAVLNKDGIFQIEDTIIRVMRFYIFSINNADENTLTLLNEYANEENIDEVVLPTNVTAYKLARTITEANKNNVSSYDISYTEARDYWVGSKTRYKLVAGYICYSKTHPINITEYYSSSKFEKGTRNLRGIWTWNKDWAQPLSLNCGNTFNVKYGKVNLLMTRSSILQEFGKKTELRIYYWYDPNAKYVYFFEPINMYSIHKSIRAENSLEITISKP